MARNADFYVSFDSNAGEFAQGIATHLASAQAAITKFDSGMSGLAALGGVLERQANAVAGTIKTLGSDLGKAGVVRVELNDKSDGGSGASSGKGGSSAEVAKMGEALSGITRDLNSWRSTMEGVFSDLKASLVASGAVQQERSRKSGVSTATHAGQPVVSDANAYNAGARAHNQRHGTNYPTNLTRGELARKTVPQGTVSGSEYSRLKTQAERRAADKASIGDTRPSQPTTATATPVSATITAASFTKLTEAVKGGSKRQAKATERVETSVNSVKASIDALAAKLAGGKASSSRPTQTSDTTTTGGAVDTSRLSGKSKKTGAKLNADLDEVEAAVEQATASGDLTALPALLAQVREIRAKGEKMVATPAQRQATKAENKARFRSQPRQESQAEQSFGKMAMAMDISAGRGEVGDMLKKPVTAGSPIQEPMAFMRDIVENFQGAGVDPGSAGLDDSARAAWSKVWNENTGAWKKKGTRGVNKGNMLEVVRGLGEVMRQNPIKPAADATPEQRMLADKVNAYRNRPEMVPSKLDANTRSIISEIGTGQESPQVSEAFDLIGRNARAGGSTGERGALRTNPLGVRSALTGVTNEALATARETVETHLNTMAQQGLRAAQVSTATGNSDLNDPLVNPYQKVAGNDAESHQANRALSKLRQSYDFLDQYPDLMRQADLAESAPGRAQGWLSEMGKDPSTLSKKKQSRVRDEAGRLREYAQDYRVDGVHDDWQDIPRDALMARRVGRQAFAQNRAAGIESRANRTAVRSAFTDVLTGSQGTTGAARQPIGSLFQGIRENGQGQLVPRDEYAGLVKNAAERKARARARKDGRKKVTDTDVREAEQGLVAPLNKARNALESFVTTGENKEPLPKDLQKGLEDFAAVADKVASGKKLSGDEDARLGEASVFTGKDLRAEIGKRGAGVVSEEVTQRATLAHKEEQMYSAYDELMGERGLGLRKQDPDLMRQADLMESAPGRAQGWLSEMGKESTLSPEKRRGIREKAGRLREYAQGLGHSAPTVQVPGLGGRDVSVFSSAERGRRMELDKAEQGKVLARGREINERRRGLGLDLPMDGKGQLAVTSVKKADLGGTVEKMAARLREFGVVFDKKVNPQILAGSLTSVDEMYGAFDKLRQSGELVLSDIPKASRDKAQHETLPQKGQNTSGQAVLNQSGGSGDLERRRQALLARQRERALTGVARGRVPDSPEAGAAKLLESRLSEPGRLRAHVGQIAGAQSQVDTLEQDAATWQSRVDKNQAQLDAIPENKNKKPRRKKERNLSRQNAILERKMAELKKWREALARRQGSLTDYLARYDTALEEAETWRGLTEEEPAKRGAPSHGAKQDVLSTDERKAIVDAEGAAKTRLDSLTTTPGIKQRKLDGLGLPTKEEVAEAKTAHAEAKKLSAAISQEPKRAARTAPKTHELPVDPEEQQRLKDFRTSQAAEAEAARASGAVSTEKGPRKLGTLKELTAAQKEYHGEVAATTQAEKAAEASGAKAGDAASGDGVERPAKGAEGVSTAPATRRSTAEAGLSKKVDQDNDVAAIEKVVAAINKLTAVVKAGIPVSKMPQQQSESASGLVDDKGNQLSSVQKLGEPLPQPRPKFETKEFAAAGGGEQPRRAESFTSGHRQQLIAGLNKQSGGAALGDQARAAVLAKDRQAQLAVASKAVAAGMIGAKNATSLFADEVGMSTVKAKAFEKELKKMVAGERALAAQGKNVATDVRKKGQDGRIAATAKARISGLSPEAHRLGAEFGKAWAKGEQDAIVKGMARLAAIVKEESAKMGVTSAQGVRRNIQDVLTSNGVTDMSGTELKEHTRGITSALGGSGESTASTKKAGQQVGTHFGANVSEGAMGTIQRTMFGAHGFWSRVVNSAGLFMVRNFAAGMVFGLTNALKEVIAAALETESTFVRVSHALESTGRDAGNLRSDLLAVSTAYGVNLKDVYTTAAGLTGVFKDTESIAGATKIVTQLQMISDGALNATEGMSALSSVSAAYGLHTVDALSHVADVMTVIQNNLGTNIEVAIEGVGAISGLAKQLGLGLEESAVYVSQIAKMTNQTGAAAGEQFARILSVVQTGRGQQSLKNNLAGSGIEAPLANRDYSSVLRILMRDYQNLGKAQQDQIATTLGGQRQAKAINALLLDGAKVLDTITLAQQSRGDAEERAQRISQQINVQFQKLRTNMQAFGAELVRSGALNILGVGLKAVNTGLSGVSQGLSKMNTLIDQSPVARAVRGWTGALLGFIVAMKIGLVAAGSLRGSLGKLNGTVLAAGQKAGVIGPGAAAGVAGAVDADGNPIRRKPGLWDRGVQRGAYARSRGISFRAAGRSEGYLNWRREEGLGTRPGPFGVGYRPELGDQEPTWAQKSSEKWGGRAAALRAQRLAKPTFAVGADGTATAAGLTKTAKAMRVMEAGATGMSRVMNRAARAAAFMNRNMALLSVGMMAIGAVLMGLYADYQRSQQLGKDVQTRFERTSGENRTKTDAELQKEKDAEEKGTQYQEYLEDRTKWSFTNLSRSLWNGIVGNDGLGDMGDVSGTEEEQAAAGQRTSSAQGIRKLRDRAAQGNLTVKEAADAQEQMLANLDAERTKVQENADLSAPQKAVLEAEYEQIENMIARGFQPIHTTLAGLGDINAMTIDQISKSQTLMNALANANPIDIKEVEEGLRTAIEGIGLTEGSDVLGLLEDATVGDRDFSHPYLDAPIKATPKTKAEKAEAVAKQTQFLLKNAEKEFQLIRARGDAEDSQDYQAAESKFYELLGQAETSRVAAVEARLAEFRGRGDNARVVGDFGKSAKAAEAAAEKLRDAAKEGGYRASDPAKYYEMMGQASQLEEQAASDRITKASELLVIEKAGTRNAERMIQIDLELARIQLEEASSYQQRRDAREKLATAEQAALDQKQKVIDSRFTLESARTRNTADKASIDREKAEQALAEGRSRGLDEGELNGRQAAVAQARQSERDARVAERNAARQTTLTRIAPNDTRALARQRLANARAAVRDALVFKKSSEAYQSALREQIEAERNIAQVESSIRQARISLRQARDTAKGHVVKAAQHGIETAKEELRLALLQSKGKATESVIRARASVINARAQARDTKLQYELDTIDFNKEMGFITGTEAVRALQEMLKAKDLTEQQRRDIMRKIKGLQDDIRNTLTGSGLNIPTEIKLPTAYEVRRSLGTDAARDAILASVVDVRKMQDAASTSLGAVGTPGGKGATAVLATQPTDPALVKAVAGVRDAVVANGAQQVYQDIDINQQVGNPAMIKAIVTEVVKVLERSARKAQRSNTSTPRTVR